MDLSTARKLTMSRGHYAPALVTPATKYGTAIEMDAFHGQPDDGDEDIYWLTTDRDHAASFGPVTERHVEIGTALVLDAQQDIRLRNLAGPEADTKLRKILERSPATAAIVIGWEGSGLTILLANPL